MKKPKVWETSLRDGQQTDGVIFTKEAKRTIAARLRDYGVDAIEAGSACNGKSEIEAIRGVCEELGSGEKVASFARLVNRDVDAVSLSGAGIVSLVFPSSDLHISNKLKTDRRGAVPEILKTTEYALQRGLGVCLLAEDGSRANPDFLVHVALEAQKLGSGVAGFCVCDTVGILLPDQTHALAEFLLENGVKNLAFHGHNDNGLAVANTLAALYAGAEWFHGTINGLGERCGNCPVEQVALNLQLSYGIRTLALERTSELSKFVAGVSNFNPALNQPIVGKNAFRHKAGIHIGSVLTGGGEVYEPYPPEVVGSRRVVTLGVQSGMKGVKYKLQELHAEFPDEKLPNLLEAVKEMGQTGNDVSDADFLMLVEKVKGSGMHERVKIQEISVNTGNRATPTATVFLKLNGDEKPKFGAGAGDGPVDAAIRAVNSALGGNVAELLSYHVDSIVGGSDASIRVSEEVRVGDKAISSSAVGTDIVLVSVDAYVKAVNVLL